MTSQKRKHRMKNINQQTISQKVGNEKTKLKNVIWEQHFPDFICADNDAKLKQ